MVIEKIVKNNRGDILYITVKEQNQFYDISFDNLCFYHSQGRVENVIITQNGIIRAKRGHLNIVVEKRDILNLDDYRNTASYDGNTPKFGVTLRGSNYIVKTHKSNSLDVSVYCEYVASTFIRLLGYNVHITQLEMYKGEVVVLMKDFTGKGYTLRSYKDTGQSSEDTDLTNKHYSYKDIERLILKHTKLSNKQKEKALSQFWDMYVLDAVLANRDRHHGNWGYLCDGNNYKIAPIYDNGACLFPNVDINITGYISNRKQFLADRSEGISCFIA